MKTTLAWSVCLLVVAGLTWAACAESRRASRRSWELERSAGLGERLRRLRQENRSLQASALDSREIERLRAARSEVESLTKEINALKLAEEDSSPSPWFKRTLAADWAYAGRSTPANSFESVLWAASRGNVDQLCELIDLAGRPKETAEALYNNLPASSRQEYSSARKMVATLLAASFPQDAAAADPITENESGIDAYLSVQVEHSEAKPRLNLYHLRKESDGWRLLIPEGVMADFEKTLSGDSPAASQGHS